MLNFISFSIQSMEVTSVFVACIIAQIVIMISLWYRSKGNENKKIDTKVRFYRHFKYDPSNAQMPNNYTYEVLGIGNHTETNEKFVTYRPLYNNPHMKGINFIHRPYDMFFGTVQRSTYSGNRFNEIKDQKTIEQLIEVSKSKYPNLQRI